MPPRKRAPPVEKVHEVHEDTVKQEDPSTEHVFVQLAKQHWLKPTTSKRPVTKVKVKADVLKEQIWDVLEKEDFQFQSLLLLENLQLLESYLWPGYSDDSSNFHVLLIALITNVKTREHLQTWGM